VCSTFGLSAEIWNLIYLLKSDYLFLMLPRETAKGLSGTRETVKGLVGTKAVCSTFYLSAEIWFFCF
jgi:hypothetical protein